jgi:hypothetical protein
MCCARRSRNSGSSAVLVTWCGDLFGEEEPLNRAGIVHPDDWTARLAENFEQLYAARLRDGRALDIAAALRLASTRTLDPPLRDHAG